MTTPWLVEKVRQEDLERARPGFALLVTLSGVAIDLDSEARLPHSTLWVAHRASIEAPGAYAVTWTAADEMQLIDLATQPDVRRQGAARALLSALVRDAKVKQLSAIFLEVRASNAAAIALYERCGYTSTRVRRGYYAGGGDACEMRCDSV